ncbi:hypothetical protein ACFT38_46720 [Streptomyces sp. NPDC056975]
MHANGDAAIRLVLDAFEQAARDLPRPGLRRASSTAASSTTGSSPG